MHRGIYFDAWHRGQHCYHPSLPTRRLTMVEDIGRYNGTVLVWAAMGGGSLSLPYLEHEVDGPVAMRDRLYGAVTDREFVAACERQGITVFGVVFEAQGWEFPVELDDDGQVVALNELRGAGERGWLGLREFTQNRYPALWPPFEHYFPGGLTNSRGLPVTDLIDECVSRGLDGSPYHAHWVECPDREHQCFYMDRNNPVWREYLKAVIRIQIDAGVQGVQLDEASTPLGTLQYGACFCHDCTTGFATYLAGLPVAALPDLEGVAPETFDYGAYLRRLGADPRELGPATPLIEHYFDYQRTAVTGAFAELAIYAREYAAARGRSILVSGNLFNIFPYYNGIVDLVDIVITETRNLRLRQPEWYRYVVGMGRGKDVVVVENPYGGVVPELLADLGRGRGYDVVRLLAYEAAAMGANMSLPYGAWMGSELHDSLSYPDELAVEVQSYLFEIDELLSPMSVNDVCVLFDVGAQARYSLHNEVFADLKRNDETSVEAPFHVVGRVLVDHGIPFDVLPANDDVVPAWQLSADDLTRYGVVILAGCTHLTAGVADALAGYAAAGGRILLVDTPGHRFPEAESVSAPEVAERVAPHSRIRRVTPGDPGVNTHALDDGRIAVHLINYSIEDGVIQRISDIGVTLPPEAAGGPCRLVRPGLPDVELPVVDVDGAATVIVPFVDVHAVLVVPCP